MLATIKKSFVGRKLKHFLRHKRLNAPNMTTEFQFPNEFDPSIYKTNYKKLIYYTPEQLYQHYKTKGLMQGKRAHKLRDRIDFVRLIPSDKKILEIGPFFRPLARGKNVFYLDVLNKAGLAERAKSLGFPDEAHNCPEIQFVSPTGDLNIIQEKFDVVLSSHCIEHQPNLIKHLNDVENILNDGGYYFLMAPDKRYCFDHFMIESNVAQVIARYEEGGAFHTLASLIEQRILKTHNDSIKHWKGEHGTVTIIKEKLEDIIYKYKNAGGEYIDSHAWYFTPDSFKNMITILHDTSYIQLKIERIYSTLYGMNEFWAILKKTPYENKTY